MDQLDKKLYNDLNTQIEISDELDAIIKNGLNKKKTYGSIIKKVACVCIITLTTSGIVFAAGKVYEENIWSVPQKVTGDNANNNDNQNATKKNTMSEDEARKKGEEILEKFGYENDKIKTIELQGNPANYDLTWCIKTEQNILIDFDANGEGTFSIYNDNIPDKDKRNYRTTKKDAENTAKEIAQKFGYNTEQYTYVEVKSNLNSEVESYTWTVIFLKEYEGIRNPYERIEISFIPQINEIRSFIVIDKKFENNPVEISEERAKEIALNEEKKINTKYEIGKIDTDLRIVSMNGDAYFRTNNYDQLHEQYSSSNYPYEKWVYYRTESRIRKAWIVTVIYDIPDSVNKFDGSYSVNDEKFSYFIDATTGEVIGGGVVITI